jgi:hypothetical protein
LIFAINISDNITARPTPAAAAWSLVHGLSLLLIDGRVGAEVEDTDALIKAVTGVFASGLGR